MSRHHKPHDFKAGEEVTVLSGWRRDTRYPGVVDRVTATQVHVVYDASRTAGQKKIRRTFWGATGCQVGYSGGPALRKREEGETFP